MPDFTYEIAWECTSDFRKEVVGSKGDIYIVSFGNAKNGEDFSCTCPAYKHRDGLCKHIKAVMHEKCNYHSLVHLPPKVVDGKKVCPNCGSELRAVRVAV